LSIGHTMTDDWWLMTDDWWLMIHDWLLIIDFFTIKLKYSSMQTTKKPQA
jgi:hypothetical protein